MVNQVYAKGVRSSNDERCVRVPTPVGTIGSEDRPVPTMSGHESRITCHFSTGCRPPAQMLRFGVL